MTKRETEQAARMLSPYTDRTERCGIDGGGWAITAHWLTGGQVLFYSLDAVEDRIASIREYQTTRQEILES